MSTGNYNDSTAKLYTDVGMFTCSEQIGEDATAATWLEQYVNVPAWRHTVYTWRRDLLYGDYLISKNKEDIISLLVL